VLTKLTTTAALVIGFIYLVNSGQLVSAIEAIFNGLSSCAANTNIPAPPPPGEGAITSVGTVGTKQVMLIKF
jgi:hypothetical protein